MNYKVYQGTELKQTVTSKTAVMNGLQPNRTYEFGVQPNDGNRDGIKVSKSVTTRGIRFNIPKTLMVGSTITLRYEEYPLGIVPIGNEPSGYFGGGNKQNLSAKIISTANGSSVVEVAGNVIEVGGRNLLAGIDNAVHQAPGWFQLVTNIPTKFVKVGQPLCFSAFINNAPYAKYTVKGGTVCVVQAKDSSGNILLQNNGNVINFDADGVSQVSLIVPDNTDSVLLFVLTNGMNRNTYYGYPKFEQGTIATPYAAFVDGDTFTAQPDGTCALFSEYKALYY